MHMLAPENIYNNVKVSKPKNNKHNKNLGQSKDRKVVCVTHLLKCEF